MVAVRAADTVCLVVPCFNERQRLATEQLCSLAADPAVSLVLVDDGSTDGTLQLLHSIGHDRPTITVIALASNGGKGEAVRAGLLHAVATDAQWVGYIDADMAAPAAEILRLLEVASWAEVDVMMGSRVALLGRDLDRSAFRHYTGRVFATLASMVLAKPVYDTQCGAKLFRNTDAIVSAIADPFRSRWAFDVELLGRLHAAGVPPSRFWEEPLLIWHDIDGSRRSLGASVRASADLWFIWRDMRRGRR
jgi:dolichyl-phosphate beta-glucosyltransferase